MAQWVAHLTHNVEAVGLRPIKGPGCYLVSYLPPPPQKKKGSCASVSLDLTRRQPI